MKDKNNQIHIAVAMQNSVISFYSVTVHEDDILGIVGAEEYEQLQHESHVNQKDLRAYIDKDGNRKIGAFDNTQPTQYHTWSESEADWVISKEDKERLESEQEKAETAEKLATLEAQKQSLIGEMQMHQLLGETEEAKAIAEKVKEINEAIEQLKEKSK